MPYSSLPFYLFYCALCLILCWHDYRTGLLPDRFTCPLLWSGILFHLCINPSQLSAALWGALAGYGAFALIYWGYRGIYRREGLGYGDVKLIAALGVWHGWQRLPILVLIACLLALLFICLAALHHGNRQNIKNPLAFGPFLATAGFVVAGLTWR